MKLSKILAAVSCASIMAIGVAAQSNAPMVGGAAMDSSKNIVENASRANNLTTLVMAVKAAALVDTLEGSGPFTVFAPTNEAFDKLPAGTLDTLVKPENQDQLKKILTYHVVPGKVTSTKLIAMIKKGGGQASLKTVEGGTIIAKLDGGNVVLTDEKGGMATVTQADVMQKNGVVHVIDTVIMPE
jgi:uncharacterized surface protein with fasciclin (FAS1) repeats